jgi:hypothetical protein
MFTQVSTWAKAANAGWKCGPKLASSLVNPLFYRFYDNNFMYVVALIAELCPKSPEDTRQAEMA